MARGWPGITFHSHCWKRSIFFLPTFRVVLRAVGRVVLHDVVVVVLKALLARLDDAAAAVLAVDLLVLQGKLIPRHQLLLAGDAPEALHVEDLALGPHHKVVFAKGAEALVALGSV